MKIAVLNHIDGSVDILDTDIQPTFDFDYDAWLTEHGYTPSCCSWMTEVKTIAFIDMKKC
jgi:hypothetical protein